MARVYEQLAGLAEAYHNCIKSGNVEWQEQHLDAMNQIADNCLPSGSGIDSGCTIDHDRSNANRLVICSSYYVMNEDGCYTHWIVFTVTVRPSLAHCFELSIKGKFGKEQDLKDYLLYQTFEDHLMDEWKN